MDYCKLVEMIDDITFLKGEAKRAAYDLASEGELQNEVTKIWAKIHLDLCLISGQLEDLKARQ